MGIVEIADVVTWGRRALEHYAEAEELTAKVREAIASGKAAEGSNDLAELKSLLERANERRLASQADFDQALAAL